MTNNNIKKTNPTYYNWEIYFPMNPNKRSEAIKWGRGSFRCSLEGGCELDVYDDICTEYKKYYDPMIFSDDISILTELYYRYEYARMKCYCISESEGYSEATYKKWRKRLLAVAQEFMKLIRELDCPAFNHFKDYRMDINMNEFYYATQDMTKYFN